MKKHNFHKKSGPNLISFAFSRGGRVKTNLCSSQAFFLSCKAINGFSLVAIVGANDGRLPLHCWCKRPWFSHTMQGQCTVVYSTLYGQTTVVYSTMYGQMTVVQSTMQGQTTVIYSTMYGQMTIFTPTMLTKRPSFSRVYVFVLLSVPRLLWLFIQ